MREGRYNRPTNYVEHRPRIAAVLLSYVKDGQEEIVPGRYRDECNFDGSGEDHFHFTENKLDLIKFTLACHEHYDAGAAYDLVICDNSSPDEETRLFLEAYGAAHGIRLITRPNTGFSFGQAKEVYETLREEYDYFFFAEQDFTPCRHGWLAEAMRLFHSKPDIGWVGNIVEPYRTRDYFEEWRVFDTKYLGDYWEKSGDDFVQVNVDGGTGLTSTRVLDECGLNVIEMKLQSDDPEDWDITPGVNELFFPHFILDRGYRLLSMHDDGYHVFTHGVCYADFGDVKPTDSQLPWLCHGQTLYCNARMREHFGKWYSHLDRFEYAKG